MADKISDNELTNDDFDLAFEAAAGVVDLLGDTDDDKGVVTAKASADEEIVAEASADEEVDVKADADEEIAAKATADEEAAASAVAEEAAAKLAKPVKKEPPVKEDTAAKAAAEEAATKAVEEATAREKFTAEEEELIASVQADFPEVRQAMAAQERVLMAKFENMLAAKLGEVTNNLTTQMAPALSAAQVSARNEHEAAILKGHADAFTILPDVEKWVETQPEFLKRSYNEVLDNGSASDIVDLFNIYKKVNGSAQPQPTAEEIAQKAEKKKRLDAQEGVRGRHTGGRATVDPDDFDGAFEKFAETA